MPKYNRSSHHVSNRRNRGNSIEIHQQRDRRMRCAKCYGSTKTNNSQFGHLCNRCKRPEKYRWREKQTTIAIHKPETDAYNRNNSYETSIYRSIPDSYESQCNMPEEIWERRVFPTPPQQLNNSYPQRNSEIPFTAQFHGEGHTNFEVTSEASTSSSGYNSSNTLMNAGVSQNSFDSGFIIRQKLENLSSKTIRPASPPIFHTYGPDPFSENAYMSHKSFDRGFKRRQESQNQSSKRHRSASPPIFQTNVTEPFFENDYRSQTSLDGGLKRKRESENWSSKRMRPASPPIFQTVVPEPFYELSNNILKYFHDNCQTEEVFITKRALWNKLQRIIRSKFDADLFMFGSSMNGFGTATSDMDMCLMMPHEQKNLKKKMYTVKTLHQILKLFRRQNFLKDPSVIPAKVPILKFQHTGSGFDIDININNPTGIRNSQLLRSYARIDERVRPLVLAVKFWARFHDINDAKFNTLSSYALGLMVIHYLQYACKPPVLPALQMIQLDKYRPNSDVRDLKLNEDLPHFRSQNKDNVGKLFAGFLHYYSREYDFETSRISVRMGIVIPRIELALNDQHQLRHWIDIEEPFELTNVARSVANSSKFGYIKSVFDNSCELVLQQQTMPFS